MSDGSCIAGLIGAGPYDVHSYHHQGVDRLADALVVTARTDDGLVQAAEAADGAYLVAVQWHPEENGDDRRLFAGLVEAARAYATDRTRGESA